MDFEVTTTEVDIIPPPEIKSTKKKRRRNRLAERAKTYKFDLTLLEAELDKAYLDFKEDDNEQTRTAIYEAIREIAFAILTVGNYPKTHMDNEQMAYEYALYLFERLVTGSFKPEFDTKMPWQRYIDLNLKHVVFKIKDDDTSWIDLVDDMEFLIDSFGQGELVNPNEEIYKNICKEKLANELFKALRIFYTIDDIKRLLPLSLDMIHSNPKYVVHEEMPTDIKEFSVTMIALAKKIISEDNADNNREVTKKDLTKMFSSAVRSTIFLSSIVNTDFFPRELLLALDLDSLYRLVQVSGGKNFRIPTQRELDTLVGTVVTASKLIIEGRIEDKEIKESLNESKKDFDLVFSHRVSIQNFVKKTIDTVNQFGADKDSKSILSMVSMSTGSLNTLFQELLEDYKQDPEIIDPDYLYEFQESLKSSISDLQNISTSLNELLGKND